MGARFLLTLPSRLAHREAVRCCLIHTRSCGRRRRLPAVSERLLTIFVRRASATRRSVSSRFSSGPRASRSSQKTQQTSRVGTVNGQASPPAEADKGPCDQSMWGYHGFVRDSIIGPTSRLWVVDPRRAAALWASVWHDACMAAHGTSEAFGFAASDIESQILGQFVKVKFVVASAGNLPDSPSSPHLPPCGFQYSAG